MKVQAVDKQDKPLKLISRKKAHKELILHRAVSVFVVNSKGELLLQQRSRFKKLWPLFWSNTCCTHSQENEPPLQSAQRRLYQEMGLRLKLKPIFKLSYCFEYKNGEGECELTWVFIARYNKETIKPDPQEAADFKWIGLPELKKQINKNSGQFTPWFKKIITSRKFITELGREMEND